MANKEVKTRTSWAVDQILQCIKISLNFIEWATYYFWSKNQGMEPEYDPAQHNFRMYLITESLFMKTGQNFLDSMNQKELLT